MLYVSFQFRIEIHFFRLHWEMKGQWSRINLVKCEALFKDLHATFKDLHATSIPSFPMQMKKCVLQSLYYAKAMKNP